MKFLGLFMTALACVSASAQSDFPARPLKIVVPFTAGGIVDSVARVVGEKMAAQYGQAVVIENKTGAGGSIGTDWVAKAPADGYTLLLVSPSHAVLPSLQKGITWNPVRDFKAVAGVGFVPNVFVVHPGIPVRTMAELVERAKKSPAPMTYASAGVGTSNHLSGELLAQEAGVKLTHVAYKGQTDALADLLAGRVDMMPMTAALAMPHTRSGKLKALAVTTSRRSAVFPELPTVAEAARLPNYQVGTWFGLVAPGKTPQAVINKLSADMAAILAAPETVAKFEALGMELSPQTASEFDQFIGLEYNKWSRVIKQAGIEQN